MSAHGDDVCRLSAKVTDRTSPLAEIKLRHYQKRLAVFMDEHMFPNEQTLYKQAEELGPWKTYPIVEGPKPRARSVGLWNLFLPQPSRGAGTEPRKSPSRTCACPCPASCSARAGVSRPRRVTSSLGASTTACGSWVSPSACFS